MLEQAEQRAMGGTGRRGLKDPLQSDQTAYEILDVSHGATDADVQAAFASGIKNRGNVQKLTSAKRVLQNPTERSLVDLFHYLPEWAGHLVPSALQQPAVLDLVRRGSTALAWENQLRAGFPDLGAAHSLAVLWYWWAVRQGEELAGVGKSAAVAPADQMWQKAIACWSMVLSSEDFWSAPGGVGRVAANQLSGAIIDRLTGRLRDLAQKHRGSKSAGLVARYQELEVALATELRTAKYVGAAGIRTSRGKVVCGVLMLQQVELLETVKQQVEAGLRSNPSSDNLRKLQNGLSRFASVAMLIDSNKPRAALDVLDALPRKDQEAEEVKSLRVRSLHALAQQQASLNNLDGALETWEQALMLQPSTELKSSILSAVVSGCQTRAAALKQHQPEAAITLLERALKSADDAKLKLLLAELLTERGIGQINDAQKKLGADGSQDARQAIADVKKGLDDLERAAKFGSKRASDQLKTGREIYDQLNAQLASGILDLTPEAARLLNQAGQAASTGDIDEAIEITRRASVLGAEHSRAVVRKHLAQFLNQRAVRNVNAAMEWENNSSKEEEKRQRKIVKGFFHFRLIPTWLLAGDGQVGLLVLLAIPGYLASITPVSDLWKVGVGVLYGFAFLLLAIAAKKMWRSIIAMQGWQPGALGNPEEHLCELCNTHARFEMNLPGRGRSRVCEGHSEALRSALGHTGKDFTAKVSLISAEKDLAEAAKLDASDAQVRQNLQQVQTMLAQLGGTDDSVLTDDQVQTLLAAIRKSPR